MNSTQAHVYMELNESDDDDSFIEYHLNDNPETQEEINRFLGKAQSLGYTTDEWLEIEMMEDGYRRLWLVKIDGHEEWRYTMPDLTQTGYGPHSGFMQAVSA